MKVEVRPLPVEKWHKKTGKESFGNAKVIEVLFDREKGAYNTGLTEEEAQKYGKILGVDLSDTFKAEEPHPYWSTKPAWITLPIHTIVFDTEKPADYVKVKNLKASSKVARSMAAWEAGEYPNATHVIYDEAQEIAEKSVKIDLKNKCNELVAKMSAEDKIAVVKVLSKDNKSVDKMTPNFVTVEMDEIINNDPEEFLRIANMGREEIHARAKVLEMVDKHILTKEGTSYYYMSELVGVDYESTVKWFRDPQNTKLKVMILEKLQKK